MIVWVYNIRYHISVENVPKQFLPNWNNLFEFLIVLEEDRCYILCLQKITRESEVIMFIPVAENPICLLIGVF